MNEDDFLSSYQISEGAVFFATDSREEFSDMASSIGSQFDPDIFIESTKVE